MKGEWELQKEKLKLKFASLRDNDLLFTDIKFEEMMERLRIKLGITKEELQAIISES
ncbi:MAG TPA: general stress protein CsbD [Chitinophagaceae bacterium]|jgi:hypothetical protein|nr:general stress protein CsbD [Chitinophagaceae bacterium]